MVVLAVLPFFAGCGATLEIGSEHPQELVDQSALDSLIGENKQSILLSLGRPDAAFDSEKSSYLIYGAYGKQYEIYFVFVPVWGGVDPEGELFCVLLEFDEENIFRRYRMKHYSLMDKNRTPSDCAFSFFTQKEINTFTDRDEVAADMYQDGLLPAPKPAPFPPEPEAKE